MHGPVGPVKIRVVEENQAHKRRNAVDRAVIGPVRVDEGVLTYRGRGHDEGNQGKDQHRTQRINNFALVIFVFRQPLLNFSGQ